MFAQLFFLLLSLILISLAPVGSHSFWINSPLHAFLLSLIAYSCFLACMTVQARILKVFRFSSHTAIMLSQIELLTFLCAYQFGWGGHRFLFPEIRPLFALALYLVALGWAYTRTFSFRYGIKQVLFVIPFCIPFVMFGLLFDRVDSWHLLKNFSPFWRDVLTGIFDLSLLGLAMIFMPYLIVTCWRCRPLTDPQLLPRLERVCTDLNFKHGGMKIWTIMKHSCTAAIIGIVSPFRYVMFTEKLLRDFYPEEIEAILVHEIGHSRHKHLLYYPFILMGMLVTSTLIIEWLLKMVFEKVEFSFVDGNLFLVSLISFICYGLFLGLYFRFVFGFFSRLFERQADLHIFEHSSPVYMIQALDRIGTVSGGIHKQPNWHHFSIQERMDFLQSAIHNPKVIQKHHTKVKLCLWLYFIFLFANITALIFI